MYGIFKNGELTAMAKALYKEEREIKRLDGWFIAKETEMKADGKYAQYPAEVKKAYLLCEVLKELPLFISDNAIFVGAQRDAFARSYALINPSFTVEGFSGYCDPMAIYNDIEPNEEFTKERIDEVRSFTAKTKMVEMLNDTYGKAENYTKEVIFFVEQVTGHVIPDFRGALKYGIDALIKDAKSKDGEFYTAAAIALSGVKILIGRYLDIIAQQKKTCSAKRKEQLEFLEKSLNNINGGPATNLYEALQLYLLLWEIMCLEQAPNPYAFSIGNADRIFEPYRNELSREEAAELFRHFLVFYNVGDRSWAISQNVLISGRDNEGNDLTSIMSYAIMDAYFDMNLPQPILSVKLHKNTPEKLYEEMGRFFFSAGVLTPSLFNDDAIFEILNSTGIAKEDIPDYSVAGCQEPLIMGKDNGNTTNSWLNLPKVLEMVLTGGVSAITGEKLMDTEDFTLENIREVFYNVLNKVMDEMVSAANGVSTALSELKVPFLSCFMGGLETGADMRDTKVQGTKYNGSGCLVHGLTVLADSFIAIDTMIKENVADKETLVKAIKANFEGYEDLRKFLLSCSKFGNNIEEVDNEARKIAIKVSDMLRSKKNYIGNPFRPDFASPSTHLTYGYWVGATPDGRLSRDMLGYGVDPLYGEASNGLGFRMLSNMKLPFEKFCGGYASHLGIDPKFFSGDDLGVKGVQFYNNVIKPLFFNELKEGVSPFYLYVNVTTPEILRKVLANPKKYAPSGVYIMRIHGTFVNFLDLSPEIQQDIITRLDLKSTTMGC
ncbi:MAG: pyruvate formate lyase family protein [Acutalibacteraceae bacterium]|nr:pyruvate formate lyase family protein [Acutalibacteraceae bacterium]